MTDPGSFRYTKRMLDVNDFATRARAIVATAPGSVRWGRKVFLAHVQDALGLDKAEFDRLVVEANRLDLIECTRADLVSMMPADLVARSEVKHPLCGAEFHFVTARP